MNQEDYLQDLLKYYRPKGFDPFLETHRKGEEGLSYSSWEKYDGQEQIDERSVFPNELVIDIDEGDTEKRREETRQVAQYLENVANYPIIVGDTGGTGFHIHLFFKLPEGEDNHRFWRLALFDLLKEEVKENTQANPEYWDEAPVDFNVDESKGHLIRAFGGRKESTGHRKTTVTTSTLAKEEVEEIEEVNYPALNNRDDVLQINRISNKGADITLKELQEKAREKEEQEEKDRKQQYESTYQAEDDGLEALREIPAQEVLKAFFDKDVQPGDSLYCVVHGSDGTGTEEATISDENTKGMPPGRYGCFGDSCKESGETIHWHNAIDLLTEGLDMDFQEAKQELAEEFDVDLDEEDSSELTLEEKDEKVQELIDELKGMIDSGASALDRKEKKEKIYSFLVNTPKSYRTEVFGDIPGNKRDNKKAFDEFLAGYLSEHEDEEEDLEDRYSREVVNRAKNLLENEHILKKVKTVLDHKIAGEDVNKLGLFLQLLSKDTEDPLMIFGIQKQGEGKSYLAKNVIDLFPDHMVEKLTDATKSSIYRIAENEGKDFFDDKIVFFGEIPENEDDREVFQIFRQLNSEGEVQKRLTLDREDGMESAKLELEGSPAVISTTVNEGLIDEQDMSRGMAYSPEMSKKQNEKVRSFQNRAHEFPEHLLDPEDISELEEAIECALDILARDEVKMQNPFTRDINNQVPENSDNIKRDYPKTLKIAAEMPAYLYHRQRPKKEIHGREYTFVSWNDVARGIVINKKFINNMIRGRTESTMDAYQEIKEKIENTGKSYDQMRERTEDPDINVSDEYFTNKDLEKWMGLAGQTAREYTRKLDRMEMIYKDSSRKPNRHYLVETDKSETVGVTLRSLHNILASVSEREELSEWARNYIEFNGLEGSVCEEDLIEMVAFTSDQLPLELDIGLEKDNSHTTPLYQQISEYKVDEATALKLEKDGSVIMYRSGSDSQRFSDKESQNGEEEPQGEDEGSTEEISEDEESGSNSQPPGAQKEVIEALKDLGAEGRDAPTVGYVELMDMTDVENLDEVINYLKKDGQIVEVSDGEFRVTA